MKIKLWFASLFLVASPVCALTQVSGGKAQTVVAYITQREASYFEQAIKPLFEAQKGGCSCEIVNATPYNEQGALDWEALDKQLDSGFDNYKILFFDFNVRLNSDNQKILQKLNNWASKGKAIVASAGVPAPSEPSSPLSRTLFGKVDKAFIVAELQRGERLHPKSFYGPEILTALTPPRNAQGENLSSVVFVSRLAANINRKGSAEWHDHMTNVKNQSRRLWPGLEELFGR
ncbi:MAG: hypothetical protein ACLGGX_06545 [Bdellovibrionia bacterium]